MDEMLELLVKAELEAKRRYDCLGMQNSYGLEAGELLKQRLTYIEAADQYRLSQDAVAAYLKGRNATPPSC